MKQNHQTASATSLTLLLSTIGLGVLVGLGAAGISFFLEHVEQLFLGFSETTTQPLALSANGWRRFASVTIGGILAAISWYFIQTKFKKTVSINQALTDQKMPVGATIVHALTQVFYVGTGGSVGRELAPREVGAMLAQQWTNFLQKLSLSTLDHDDRRLLVAAAAGAGFAGVYLAPITGALFAIEILYKKVNQRVIAVSVGMSAIAMLVGGAFKGFAPYYLLVDKTFDWHILPFVVIASPILGAVGAIFRNAFQAANGPHKAHGRQLLWQLPVIGLLTGVIAAFFPYIMGNGRGLAELALTNTTTALLGTLLVGAILKAVVTVLTLKAGAFGGTLAPSISIGGALGAILGAGYLFLVPGMSLGQLALIGAVALLAASQQAPLMALFMMFEVTHLDYTALLPMGIAVSLAMLTSRLIIKK